MRIPSFVTISEAGTTPMPRSQSVGHSMRATQHTNKDDIRYMLSQPLLNDMKPFNESRRRLSGTLSRPDIFYQVLQFSVNRNNYSHKKRKSNKKLDTSLHQTELNG